MLPEPLKARFASDYKPSREAWRTAASVLYSLTGHMRSPR